MKKIDKSLKLSTSFFEEIQNYESGKHPNYEDGAFRRLYHKDVLMNLLACQGGLCAYTEDLIISKFQLLDKNWLNGKYNKNIGKLDADIEHFDSAQKLNNGWEWDNLFVALIFVNRDLKKSKKVKGYFKPDDPNYSPEKYLKYDFQKHIFIPNPELEDESLEAEIRNYLDFVLGINSETIISRRREILDDFKIDVIAGKESVQSLEQNKLKRFHTAFMMSKTELSKW